MRLGFFVLFFIFSCTNNDKLVPVCPKYCMFSETERLQITESEFYAYKRSMNVGECRYGLSVCDQNGFVVACENAILPKVEKCDGLDNDCDGKVDETWNGPMRLGRYDVGFPCMSLGECQKTEAICIDGQWKCDYPQTVELPDEKSCDGLDNDCDGRVDEEVFDDLSLSERVCYSGNPVESLSVLPCRAGALECIYGETICLNEVTPSKELCDNIDNDCNGVIDDTGDTLLAKYDIVFVIDTSGSMCDEISAVAGACNAYAEQFDGNSNFRFALVIMTARWYPFVVVDTDFTDFATIRTRLTSLGCTGGGAEASLDSLENVCNKVVNPLSLSWRENANGILFAFTDEPQQSYESPQTTGMDIIDACLLSNTLPFVWSYYPADFEYVAQGSNGEHFRLSNDWEKIFNDMNSIIIKLCGSGS